MRERRYACRLTLCMAGQRDQYWISVRHAGAYSRASTSYRGQDADGREKPDHDGQRGNSPDGNAQARLRQFRVFRRLQVHPGVGVDPAHVVVNLLYARDVLRADNGCLPRALLSNDAAEMNDAVAHDHAQSERTPVVALQAVNDALANM